MFGTVEDYMELVSAKIFYGDDTGKKIYVPWKKNSSSLENIFTAPGKEI